jgi:hypothetical protein
MTKAAATIASKATGLPIMASPCGCARGGGWQHDVVRLNSCEFFEHRARGISETGALLPHLALPQHESEKADQDMSLDAVSAVLSL